MTERGRVLRRAGLAIGVLYLVAAGIVEAAGASQLRLIYLALAGVLVLASVFSWRTASGRRDAGPAGYWQLTGQRFSRSGYRPHDGGPPQSRDG